MWKIHANKWNHIPFVVGWKNVSLAFFFFLLCFASVFSVQISTFYTKKYVRESTTFHDAWPSFYLLFSHSYSCFVSLSLRYMDTRLCRLSLRLSSFLTPISSPAGNKKTAKYLRLLFALLMWCRQNGHRSPCIYFHYLSEFRVICHTFFVTFNSRGLSRFFKFNKHILSLFLIHFNLLVLYFPRRLVSLFAQLCSRLCESTQRVSVLFAIRWRDYLSSHLLLDDDYTDQVSETLFVPWPIDLLWECSCQLSWPVYLLLLLLLLLWRVNRHTSRWWGKARQEKKRKRLT